MGRTVKYYTCNSCLKDDLTRADFTRLQLPLKDRICRDCAEDKKKDALDKTKLTLKVLEANSSNASATLQINSNNNIHDYRGDVDRENSAAAASLTRKEKRPLEGKNQMRSLRTKKRKLRLNELYFKLAEEVGLKISDDKINILEKVLTELKSRKEASSSASSAVINKNEVVGKEEEDEWKEEVKKAVALSLSLFSGGSASSGVEGGGDGGGYPLISLPELDFDFDDDFVSHAPTF